jgi:hypothetical protein
MTHEDHVTAAPVLARSEHAEAPAARGARVQAGQIATIDAVADSVRRHPVAWPLAAALVLALASAAFAPLRYPSRDQLLEIPRGTHARRAAGDSEEMLPSVVRLTLGVQDVLLLRNNDTVPQIFGPVLIMPGQDFRLPFEQASDYRVASSAHASGQVTVSVVPQPDPGWDRLRWRAAALAHAVRYLKIQAPT